MRHIVNQNRPEEGSFNCLETEYCLPYIPYYTRGGEGGQSAHIFGAVRKSKSRCQQI